MAAQPKLSDILVSITLTKEPPAAITTSQAVPVITETASPHMLVTPNNGDETQAAADQQHPCMLVGLLFDTSVQYIVHVLAVLACG